MPIRKTLQTREEFLKQAESVNPGLTEEQFIQAVIKDVNTCEYLAAQGQMYPIYDRNLFDRNFNSNEAEDFMLSCINGIIKDVESSIKLATSSTIFKHDTDGVIETFANMRFSNQLGYFNNIDIEPFEFVYLFLRSDLMKQIMKSFEITAERFIKDFIIGDFIPSSKTIKERYENRKNAAPVQSHFPYTAEKIINREGFSKTKNNKGNTYKMTREEFLKQAESVKPGLTEEQFIDALVTDSHTCEYLEAQGQMYPIEKRILDGKGDMEIINKCMIHGCVGEAVKQIENGQDIECAKYGVEAMDLIYAHGYMLSELLYPFEFVYLFLKDNIVKKYLELTKTSEVEFVKNHLVFHIFNGKYNSKTQEEINSNISKKAEVNEPTDYVSEKASVFDESVAEEGLNSSETMCNVSFFEGRSISVEEESNIIMMLSTDDVQKKLKGFKIRKSKSGCMLEEFADYNFNKEKYKLAFMADSMYKGKKIIVLLKADDAQEPVDIFLINENI